MNIGLLGFGVVGRGVYDMLAGRDDIRAAWVLCRRDLGELTAQTTYEMQDILDDPAVDTVVEVMGGLHPAYEYVAAALRAGKNVVSSNKYLMCRYYDELTALAKEHGAALRCTAAVGGGIPWLTNLEKAARANHISRVWGILNGTTNYIMDAMHGSDVDFADVLAQAQALGYAEADPSADIDGLDIQRKLILSANVAFGVSLREADVPVFGIRNVRKADIARFQAHGCTCKLIATAEQKSGSIRAYVEPTLLSHDALEAAVQLREALGGIVTAMTMGPAQAAQALRECYALGADRMVLVSDRRFGGADTYATSYTLAQAVRALGGFDLILCGRQAIDGDTAQVGPMLAEHLGLPQLTCACAITIEDGAIRIRQEGERAYRVLRAPLPAVVTVVKAINEPRLPNVMRKLQANRMQPQTLTADDLPALDPDCIGLHGSPTKVSKTFVPVRTKQTVRIDGAQPEAAVASLLAQLDAAHISLEGVGDHV